MDGRLAAGLHGWTWGVCLKVASLWVREHDFQAPEFYKKYGYEVVFAIEGYPQGHSKIWLKNRLT